MAVVTYSEVIDELYSAFLEAWNDASAGQAITPPGAVIFQQQAVDMVPGAPQSKPWARVTHALTGGEPRSVGARLWAYDGALTLDIYVPLKGYEQSAGTLAEYFAEKLMQKFRRLRSVSTNIRNVAPREHNKDGPYYNVPVLVSFRYFTTA